MCVIEGLRIDDGVPGSSLHLYGPRCCGSSAVLRSTQGARPAWLLGRTIRLCAILGVWGGREDLASLAANVWRLRRLPLRQSRIGAAVTRQSSLQQLPCKRKLCPKGQGSTATAVQTRCYVLCQPGWSGYGLAKKARPLGVQTVFAGSTRRGG